MKFLVFGAGAVGGIVGARLTQAGRTVTLVARGANLAAIRERGLTLHAPSGTEVVRVEATDRALVDADTIILLAVKTHDVPDALRALALVAPTTTPIVCMTNGLEAERLALRWFDRVYAMCVNTPATHVEPGVVEAWGLPVAGLFDIGCYPHGTDAMCTDVAAAFEASRLSSRVFDDVMRWKRGKLIFNLSNALDALCGLASRKHPIVDVLRAEARAVYAAAGLSTTTEAEANARRGDFKSGVIAGLVRTGGSTWQSLARGASIIECEYLNGEIALLGRLHGVPTPLNTRLLVEVTRAAAAGIAPGSLAIDDLVARITT